MSLFRSKTQRTKFGQTFVPCHATFFWTRFHSLGRHFTQCPFSKTPKSDVYQIFLQYIFQLAAKNAFKGGSQSNHFPVMWCDPCQHSCVFRINQPGWIGQGPDEEVMSQLTLGLVSEADNLCGIRVFVLLELIPWLALHAMQQGIPEATGSAESRQNPGGRISWLSTFHALCSALRRDQGQGRIRRSSHCRNLWPLPFSCDLLLCSLLGAPHCTKNLQLCLLVFVCSQLNSPRVLCEALALRPFSLRHKKLGLFGDLRPVWPCVLDIRVLVTVNSPRSSISRDCHLGFKSLVLFASCDWAKKSQNNSQWDLEMRCRDSSWYLSGYAHRLPVSAQSLHVSPCKYKKETYAKIISASVMAALSFPLQSTHS